MKTSLINKIFSIDPDKKDIYNVSRNDFSFNENDIIRIPMNFNYTHKQYNYKHFIKMKEKYKGRKAKVKNILFVFNSFWRINFSYISGYNEIQPEFHLCFVLADFLGVDKIKQLSNRDLFGVMKY